VRPAIELCDLSFAYSGGPPVLREISLSVPGGARCLLFGANGAGKTTLLRVLGGRHLVPEGAARVLGEAAFHATTLVHRAAFIGGDFPFDADVEVGEILAHQPDVDAERLERVVRVLEVDVGWHMNRVSSGQRRRVQILLHLLRPLEVLLLDEVTADLDVAARADLLDLLRDDSERLGTTILYATHVLDGLEAWATHLLYLRGGRVARYARLDEVPEIEALRVRGEPSPLWRLCLDWLRAEQSRGDSGDARA
jgi:CCR4-NOT complex subunit CAF16